MIMAKWDEVEVSEEMIQGFSDKQLDEYLADPNVPRDGWREFAVKESNRRQLTKITKNPLLVIIAFGFIVATFILAVLTFILK
jgi:predicted permease